MDSTSSTDQSSQLFQAFFGTIHSRKLLLDKTVNQTSSVVAAAAAPPSYPETASLDENVFMVLSVLLCGLICSLGLNFIVRCAIRCSNRAASSESNDDNSSAVAAATVINRGIEPKALKTFPVLSYSTDMKLPGLDTECIICLSEFVSGERLRFLPKCNHGFHVRCIDKWLKSHSSCPKCRHCLIETCQKIMGCNQSSSSDQSCLPAQETVVVNVLPLEPESMVRDYRGNNRS
ncbi:Zinc finger, RING-type [Corchorus olitorius]|uniref:RING-type E3 ubiquitin transferase n=1 Tax=Corchorus olitorius TaxID=93759 RepID=A0A1R3ILY1_9ROSI|nr:Zinc finger, RING-type [Corchorus olitorius]